MVLTLNTLIAILISSVALLMLRNRNTKRRRISGLSQAVGSSMRFVWIALLFLPGIALTLMGNISGLICWLAVLTVIGWLMATRQPDAKPKA